MSGRRVCFPMGAYGSLTSKMTTQLAIEVLLLLPVCAYAHREGCVGCVLQMRLWSTLPNIESLRRPMSFSMLRRIRRKPSGCTYLRVHIPTLSNCKLRGKKLVKRYTDRLGMRRVVGIKGALSKSASYPIGFGYAMAGHLSCFISRPACHI